MFKLQNISKAYGNYHALKNVNLTIHPGEIHGLAGVNGSGKSTLLNILSGQPIIHQTGGFSGEIIFKDHKDQSPVNKDQSPVNKNQSPVNKNQSPVKSQTPTNRSLSESERLLNFSSPKEAMLLGIGMVHQEFALLSTLTVAENITLTREKIIPFTEKLFGKNFACIDEKINTQTASSILESIGISIPEDMVTGSLSVSTRQFIEIAREMSRQDLTLLLLDEPTAVLNKTEAEKFMGAVRKIADRGTSILYVSHRIEELVSLCDRITVLRGGEVAGSLSNNDINNDKSLNKISHLMVGGSVAKTKRLRKLSANAKTKKLRRLSANKNIHAEKNHSQSIIITSNFTVDKPGDALNGLDLTVHKGEILGITGLSGHGRNALGAGIMGLYPTSGKLTLYDDQITLHDHERYDQKRVRRTEMARKMIKKNIWLVPEDRRNLGLLMDHSIMDNITFASMQNKNMFSISNGAKRFIPAFMRFQDKTACRKHAQKFVDELDIKCSSIDQKAGELSGGNQQKVCIAAALTMQPDILFVSEPTRGIDIAGKEAILTLLVKAHETFGMTIIISSGELEELKRICDRIAVVYEGRLFDVFTPDTSDDEFALAFSGLR
ncbi:MAG: sugar ABC transporter ATP-binding protein [Desulfamplus sp.]|nr:sugar ABC transporter ATP-binding protein [Desulfamplus sp.]